MSWSVKESVDVGRNTRWSICQTLIRTDKTNTLCLFDVNAHLNISADALSYGLSTILLQQNNSSWQLVAFASRVMSDTKWRYAQVEKKALAITWACEKYFELHPKQIVYSWNRSRVIGTLTWTHFPGGQIFLLQSLPGNVQKLWYFFFLLYILVKIFHAFYRNTFEYF